MTDAPRQQLRAALTDTEWWNSAIGRTIRTIWHFVGFYAAVVAPIEHLTAVLVVGVAPTPGSVPLPVAVSILLAAGLAVLLSTVRPAVSSARTLAFGFAATLLFRLAQVTFGQPQLAGRPLVAVDVALTALGALSLSAAVAFGFEWSELSSGVAES